MARFPWEAGVCEFGDAGNGKGSFEASFQLPPRSWKDYQGTRFYDGEAALVVKRWFHRLDDDASGRAFIEWDPATEDTATDAPPAAMIFNSCKLRAVFGVEEFREIIAPALNLPPATRTRSGRGAAVRAVGGEPNRFMLQPAADERARDACVAAGAHL